MFFELSLLFSSILTLCCCQYVHTPTQIKSFFEREEIIPDVLIYSPEKELKVKYGDEKCNFGTAYSASEVKEPPKVRWEHEPGAYYTLIMIDPDVPNKKNPILREYQHWLVVNIPESRTMEGQTLTEYLGVIPEQTKSIHRYVLFVYKQPGKKPINFDLMYKDKTPNNSTRGKFHTQNFAEAYKLGNVTFGNFFLSGMVLDPRYDDNMDEEYRKIGAKIDLTKPSDDDDF
nr:PREDICTED: protein D3-like isoform X1 [Bemisia tabaci]